MKISTKGRYAIRLMVDIAENDKGEYISLRDISSRQEISIKYLEQIVTLLCRAACLKSTRGPQGGYKLTKTPDKYTVGEILRITEGSLAPVACLETETNECKRERQCVTIDLWKGLHDIINTYVDKISIADLLENKKNKEIIDYEI